MTFTRSPILPEVVVAAPDVLRDGRGRFACTYQAHLYEENGIPARFVPVQVAGCQVQPISLVAA